MASHPVSPPQRTGRGWMFVSLILGVLLIILMADSFARSFFSLGFPTGQGSGNLEEVIVESHHSENKIAVVRVTGIITSQAWDGSGQTMVDLISDQLQAAKRDPKVRAVILKVDSPGGEVMASDNIAREVRDFQDPDNNGKPVVAAMGAVAASGGYYVSAPAQWIVANEMTITGSIGVIMHSLNYRRFLDKVGLYPQVFKSGELKDMLSGSKNPDDINSEEKQIIQDMIDSTYARFKTVVKNGRERAWEQNQGNGRALVEDWTRYADGRVITGAQAYDHGFVDEKGTFETAVERAMDLAGISDANIVEYREPPQLFSFSNLLGKSRSQGLTIDLGLNLPQLQPGRLYFLSSTLLN